MPHSSLLSAHPALAFGDTLVLVRWLVALLVCGFTSQWAHAQPLEQDHPVGTFAHGGIGAGINNRVSSDPETLGDLGVTVNLEFNAGYRFRHVSLSWYGALALREWRTIGRFYKRISKERGKEVAYGYLLGWLAGTDLVYTGPAATLHSQPDGAAFFASAGIGPMVFIDPRDPDAALGTGQMLAVGFGNERYGVALRTIFSTAQQHNDLALPDPTYYNVFLTIYTPGRSKKSR